MGLFRLSADKVAHIFGVRVTKRLRGKLYSHELKRIDLAGCEKLTDESTVRLSTVQSLEEINLSLCHRITDRTSEALSQLPKLRFLSLGLCYSTTDAALNTCLGGLRLLRRGALMCFP